MADREFEVDLTNCDREPIHELGAIQPFGFLVAVSSDWLVRRASANVRAHFGIEAEDMLGTPLADHLPDEVIHTFRNRLTMLRGADAVERIFGCAVTAGGERKQYDFALHMTDDTIIVEGEPTPRTDSSDAANMIRAMSTRLDMADALPAFLREGARQIRAVTGFDRVMVYRFERDGHGVVAAESARSGIGSFLDLRYPATDIPKQARRLYLRTPFRIIADIAAEPVPIVPARDERGEPLDLSLSILRSVSPIHVEYLKNMNVDASLSISIIVEGELWGLFACHHYSGPLLPDFERRSVAELFGQMFSLKLESRLRQEAFAFESAARRTGDRLLAAVAGDATLLDDPAWVAETIGQTIPNDGVGIWIDGRVASGGLTPPTAAFGDIVRRLNAMAAGRVFATDRLADVLPRASEYEEASAGLLAIPISRSPRDYVLLFRQEQVRTVTWAGDPQKPASPGPNGMRLSPRQSFEAWREEVRGRSRPFTDAEIRVAEMLRASLIEVVLRMSDSAQAERQRASERQELLIAELNHRVRNILALIRGLVRQSGGQAQRTEDFVSLLEGRIEALARAHDQITKENWGSGALRGLIDTEAAAYLGGQANRIVLNGPAVLLRPQAFSTLALVVHELVTNSAKYGALSDSGSVHVDWSIGDLGALRIAWRERGGPAVQAPTRQGFGTTIITRSIPYDLGGTASTDYRLAGLEAAFEIPERFIAGVGSDAAATDADAEQQPAEVASPAGAGAGAGAGAMLSGVTLLVEDSLIIAMDAEDVLLQLGAAQVVIASNVRQAIAEIEREAPAFAVLDVNLAIETSLPVADMLRERGIPYLFATGYGEQLQLPAEHADVAVVQKPYNAASLSAGLQRQHRQDR